MAGETGPTPQYQEGGGPNPPYQEDYFQRIVNVQWLAGPTGPAPPTLTVFAMGDICCFVCYVAAQPSNTTFASTPLGSLDFGDHGDIWGGSYQKIGGQPTFLFSGSDFDSVGHIMASFDGQNWTTVYVMPSISPGVVATGSVEGIVWDAGQFWAGAFEEYNPSGSSPVHSDILLSSSDGLSWSEVNRVDISSISGSAYAGLLVAHCNPRVLDEFGHAVPDGIYHYSQEADGSTIFIRPDAVPAILYAAGVLHLDSLGKTITIEVTKAGATTTKSVDVGLGKVACVAYANGVIVAAGQVDYPSGGHDSAFAISFDMGETWTQQIYNPDAPPVSAVLGTADVVQGGAAIPASARIKGSEQPVYFARETLMRLQAALGVTPYGKLNGATRRAIWQYQRRHGLPLTEWPEEALIEQIIIGES